ncbi:NfeD family protein [candidate division KSB1 bacterium]|nr:NfeD family protein [candidate division KSB1 bacterium]
MEIKTWIIWMIFAALMVIGEIFTAGFFLFWFGVGAFAAALAAILGMSPVWQLAIFVVVSGILVAASRKFAKKVSIEQPPGIGADRLKGKIGVVLEEINNLNNTGRVRLEKEEWRAESSSNVTIRANRKVMVVKLEGTHLVVEPIEEEE